MRHRLTQFVRDDVEFQRRYVRIFRRFRDQADFEGSLLVTAKAAVVKIQQTDDAKAAKDWAITAAVLIDKAIAVSGGR